MRSTLLLTLFALLAVGCGKAVHVEGTVTDASGTALEGAKIEVFDTTQCCSGDSCTATSDSSGKWKIDFDPATPGEETGSATYLECQYTASKTGYKGATGNFKYCKTGVCLESNKLVETKVTLQPQ